MIIDRVELYKRIENHVFDNGNASTLDEKLRCFENAVEESVKQTCEEILGNSPKVHLAYSGGIDSSLVLKKIVQFRYPLVAHTMATSGTHPDMKSATRYIQCLKEQSIDIEHIKHIVSVSEQDLSESNRLLGLQDTEPDNYYMLMKALALHCYKIMTCDCIDELMGGYYSHQNAKDKLEALRRHLSRLIPDHLQILDRISSHFGIDVWEPYGSEPVMASARAFNVGELVDDSARKKPVYLIAARNDIPKEIIERRKYGLCSALDAIL